MLLFIVVQSPSCFWLFVTPWTAARQASLFLTISRSLPKFMSIASVMPSSHLVPWHTSLLLSSNFPNVRDFSNESTVCIRWPKYGAVIAFTDHCLFMVKKFMSLKLWAMPCKATQDGQVIVENSDKTWSTCRREWQTTPVYLPWEPHELYK